MKGYVDRLDSVIAGWVFDPLFPGKPADIVIENDGRELYRCVADIYRSDLIPVIGEGEHGFGFEPGEEHGFDKDMRLQIFAITDRKYLLYEGNWKYQGKVIQGADNWLFLNRDSNQVNLRIAGEFGVDVESVYRTALQIASREAMLSQMKLPYLALIVPEKNVVCSKNFPGLKISENRPVRLILEQARKLGSEPIYPISEFLSSKDDVFYRTDTHANARGYDIIYNILRERLPEMFGNGAMPRAKLNEEFCGDLGEKLYPRRTEVVERYEQPVTPSHFYNYNSIEKIFKTGGRLRGEIVSVLNRNATGRLLVFGTSSAYHALPLISCAFEHTLYIWENTFDYRIIEIFSPDCVLWLPPERFLPMQVDDVKGLPSTLDQVQKLLLQ